MDIYDRAQELEARQREAAIARHAARHPARTASLCQCEDCGEDIPPRRRELVPGVTRCIDCQTLAERRP
ncbi:TraR/DksA C4-type zinc finger protein [Laribacter hongkongensis]|uniref:TraR/DksA C4-type zinc finger protein n=1 Tax=Laribacter hongkongensis TaxID=168471 RepID=UPI001EFC58B9|nr:TraR/DksA C4-type zinc finger protein [Laribacter hongkongensis]MCG9124297.1 TraR/DksA C4-type zinc finger protein [Laribacter hongkongensis]